jgi:hypothetical protein
MRGKRTVDQRHAEAPTEHPEHGICRHHPQVSQQCQLQAARYRMAFDGGDQRLAQQHATRPHGPVALLLQAIAPLVPCRHRAQIGAGADGATGAGKHRHPRRLVAFELAQRGGQSIGSRPVDGVAHVGAVDNQGGNRAVLLDQNIHGGVAPAGLAAP